MATEEHGGDSNIAQTFGLTMAGDTAAKEPVKPSEPLKEDGEARTPRRRDPARARALVRQKRG